MHSTTAPHALILGGYGLIGAAAMRALDQAGFQVTGLGRTQQTAQQVMPDALWPNMRWQFADLTRLSITDWQKILTDVDVVVNAAGALQDGGGTDLTAIHEEMPHRLIAALKGRTTRVVQISAAGVRPDASTEFFRSKARGDALLTASNLNYVILRPTLVLGEAAYGGTALLRAAAAMPLIDWRVMQNTQIQTVALDDLCQAIVSCARGDIAPGTIADLTEAKSRSFPEVICLMRCWLGLPPPRRSLPLPPNFCKWPPKALTSLADLVGPPPCAAQQYKPCLMGYAEIQCPGSLQVAVPAAALRRPSKPTLQACRSVGSLASTSYCLFGDDWPHGWLSNRWYFYDTRPLA
jgi:uncharacterized protein YbjT (DUF2867 family)